jgi:hypothetical protein
MIKEGIINLFVQSIVSHQMNVFDAIAVSDRDVSTTTFQFIDLFQ